MGNVIFYFNHKILEAKKGAFVHDYKRMQFIMIEPGVKQVFNILSEEFKMQVLCVIFGIRRGDEE